jgi:hypothetical protein
MVKAMAVFKDVEDLLVWAFKEQKVLGFAASFRGVSVGMSSTCSLGQVMALGTRVDSPSAAERMLGARCHEDAAVILDAVTALPEVARVELIKHARGGTVPDWHEDGPGAWVAPVDRNGKPKRLWRDPLRQRGDMGPAPLVLEGVHPDIVEEDRAIYRLWHTALCELVPMLNGEMTDHTARWPRRSPEPWWDVQGRLLHTA